MLCYRFMNRNPTSYVKFYDAEVIPLLLRPASTSSVYSNGALWCGTNVSSAGRKQQNEFIQRTTRLQFHWSPRSLSVKDRDTSSRHEQIQRNDQPATNEAEAKGATDPEPISVIDPETEKLGLFARFKKMYKEYWYVLLPVHCVTSACWLGGFYYVSISGFDVASLMESWHFNDVIVGHLRDSKLGHVAIAYFLYKCFTPLRYMVTLGGTTLSIKHLSRLGYIKPVPSKSALMKMYQDKKDSAKQAIQGKTHGDSI